MIHGRVDESLSESNLKPDDTEGSGAKDFFSTLAFEPKISVANAAAETLRKNS